MKKAVFIALALTLTIPASDGLALGKTGHRVVGEIASNHLTPEAQAAVEAILGDEELWQASYYADEMRASYDEFWRYRSAHLHYVNMPDGVSYEDSDKNPKGDAYSAVTGFIATLKNDNTSLEEKALALRFLTHLAGDLHQPMHAGHAEDRGGNSIEVKWFGQDTNLHTVWDSKLIDNQQLSFSEWVRMLDKADDETIRTYQQASPIDWVNEITVLRDGVYDVGDGNFSYQYIYDNTPLIKEQLLKGGLRLAGVLNEIFAQ